MADFFISYTRTDQPWAEWISWQLEEAGYQVLLQAWDFKAGGNFIAQMDDALKECDRTLLVLSENALHSRYVRKEWTAAFNNEQLVPVRVSECDPSGLLSTTVYIDLVGLDEDRAGRSLLEELRRGRHKPTRPPRFPRQPLNRSVPSQPRFPTTALPSTWNVPYRRNPNFVGRADHLEELYRPLRTSQPDALAYAIVGLGGMGKTQLAVEYAFRYGSEFAGVWWWRAEEDATLVADSVALAMRLELATANTQNHRQTLAELRNWLRQQAERWLLVFDNSTDPDTLVPFLPQRIFHQVLITSRNPAWLGVGQLVKVEPLEPKESAMFLQQRAGIQDGAMTDAAELARTLGHLPLALEQAGAYMERTGSSVRHYLELFAKHRADLLNTPLGSADYPDTVATTWSLSFEEASKTQGSAELLRILSFLAPQSIPRSLIEDKRAVLPEPLDQTLPTGLLYDEAFGALQRFSLIGIDTGTDTVSVHRLVQAVVRDSLESEEAFTYAGAALSLIREAFPIDCHEVDSWPECDALVGHAKAAAARTESLDLDIADTADLLRRVGVYLRGRARYPEALACYERALYLETQEFGSEDPRVAKTLTNLGVVLEKLCERKKALTCHERALAIDEKEYGPDHPYVAIDLSNLGIVLKGLGEYDQAFEYYSRALALGEQSLGLEHPTVATRHSNLGALLVTAERFEEAKSHLELALSIGEKAFGPDHPNVASILVNLGQALMELGDLENARKHSERALGIAENALGPDHPDVALFHSDLGEVLEALGDVDGSRSQHLRAREIIERAFGHEVTTHLERITHLFPDLTDRNSTR